MSNGFKYNRVLSIYTKLMDGEVISKAEEAKYFGVNARFIQRDIDDLRMFFEDKAAEGDIRRELVYSCELGGYHLVTKDKHTLSNDDAIVVSKILLESRAFTKNEMDMIINKLLNCCVQSNV